MNLATANVSKQNTRGLLSQKNIYDVVEMTVNEAISTAHGQRSCKEVIAVAGSRIRLRENWDNNVFHSLGGENQRVKLAYYLSQEKAETDLVYL